MTKFTRQKPPIQLPPDLMQAFLDSQSYAQLHELTEASLAECFQADHVALCLMSPDLPTGFDWKASTTRPFLQSYFQWFQGDFVYQWLSRNPNIASSDVEMLRGLKVEETETHRRSRESELRLRHVLAVLIDPEYQGSSGAVALYSERARPFSEKHRRQLQALTPYLKSAFRNIMRFGALSSHNQLLEEMLCQAKVVARVMDAQGREFFRTGPVTELLESWFPSRSDRDGSGIPRAWGERMTALMKGDGVFDPTQNTWRVDGGTRVLRVCFAKLPRIGGRDLWELQMKEFVLIPEEWRPLLTGKEFEVTAELIQGSRNDAIAEKLHIKTVKEHLKASFKKLKVSSRAELISKALRP